MKLDKVEDVTKLVALATALISLATKLGFMVNDIIKNADMPEAEKEAYIARIKAAQASVPEWDEDTTG